jgi:hypothetical protein
VGIALTRLGHQKEAPASLNKCDELSLGFSNHVKVDTPMLAQTKTNYFSMIKFHPPKIFSNNAY